MKRKQSIWIGPFHSFYSDSYKWKKGWSWSCFDTNIPAFLCKLCCSYANYNFSSIISIRKQSRFTSKQGQDQPHIPSKARVQTHNYKIACEQALGRVGNWQEGKPGRAEQHPLGPLFHGTHCTPDSDASSYRREHWLLTGLIDITFLVGT